MTLIDCFMADTVHVGGITSTRADYLERLMKSGLSPAQARNAICYAGYPPSVTYFIGVRRRRIAVVHVERKSETSFLFTTELKGASRRKPPRMTRRK